MGVHAVPPNLATWIPSSPAGTFQIDEAGAGSTKIEEVWDRIGDCVGLTMLLHKTLKTAQDEASDLGQII
jgi:hypothetical protein